MYNILLLNKLKYSSTREDHVCNSSGLKFRCVMIYEILLTVSRFSFSRDALCTIYPLIKCIFIINKSYVSRKTRKTYNLE